MVHSFNDVKFAEENSKRIIKSSFSVGVFLKSAENFTVKYMSSESGEVESQYLAVKMISTEKESLWLGYKVKEVLGGEKVEIDVTALLWIYIDSTVLKKQIRVNKLEEYSIASMLKSGSKDLPIKIGETAKNIDYHTRCITQLNNTIGDIYAKARIHSFFKMLTHFCIYEYDFLKSEYSHELDSIDDRFILKSRFVPLNIKYEKFDRKSAVSIYINSLKDGTKHVGLWLVAPIKESGFIDADKITFVTGLSSKNISVNSTASIANQVDIKYLPQDVLVAKDKDGGLEVWLMEIFEKYGISKFVASSNISEFIEKFEKSKDILAQEIIENICFTNINYFDENTININSLQAKEIGIFESKLKAKTEESKNDSNDIDAEKTTAEKVDAEKTTAEKVDAEKTTVEKVDAEKTTVEKVDAEKVSVKEETLNKVTTSVQASEVQVTQTEVILHPNVNEILQESIDEDGFWSYKKNGDTLVFEHNLLHCQITFEISQLLALPNKIFNEMLQLSIDPYTIIAAFGSVGYKFKEYSYQQVRKVITKLSDEVLNNYIDLENYYDLVEAEKYNRSRKKG